MPDDIQRTIYKLEIDDSGYIKGVDNLSASTKKLTDEQERANKALKTNEAALKANGEFLQKTKKDLDAYTGTNERYRLQLEKTFKGAQADQVKLTQLVAENKKQYDAATAAAQKFAGIAARATQLQQQTTGGKIPTAAPPGLQTPISNIPSFDLADTVPQTKAEFDALAIAIANAEAHLETLNVESEEFKTIKPIVDQAKVSLQQFDAATEGAAGSTLSIRGQLRQAKEELVRLEQAGKGASKEYFELEKRTARLTDAFNDQQARIRILASDTRLLDFGKGAITAATSAFQTYASVSILAGGASEDLQKKTMQLFAAMQLLQSLEQLSNLTRREGVIAVHLQSASQAVYTAVVGASTGALKAFRIALLSTGIIGAVVAIGFLVKKYLDWKASIKEVSDEQKLLNDVRNKAIEGYAKEVSRLEVLRLKLSDLNLPQKERITLAKEYNKTADEGNKIDLKQIDNIDLLNAAIDRQIGKIKERALAQAAANVTTEAATKLFEAEQKLNEINETLILDLENIDAQIKQIESSFDSASLTFALSGKRSDQQIAISLNKTLGALKQIKEANEDFTRAARLTAKLPEPEKPKDEKPVKETKEIENEFARKKAELDARLAELTRKEADNESKIRIEFSARLAKEQLEIEKLLRAKKLTRPQADILKAENVEINTIEQDKALADFRKKITDARNKLNEELQDLQNKANIDSLNLLQDEFDRRAKLIEANEKIELDNAKDATQDRLDSLELDRLLIGEKAYQDAKAVIIATGEQNALNIIARFGAERQDLAADIFRKSLDAFEQGLNTGLVARDEEIAKQIRAASDKFLKGKITFEQFQKDITKIQKDEESIRRDATLANQRAELSALDRQIQSIKDKTSNQYKALLKLREQLTATISANEKEDAIKDAEEDPNKRKTDSLGAYVAATAQLADSVVMFWQKANEAESAALDRSISLQEERVDAAQRIAARGNAQYLKQEEDRLKELQVKREAAARKQLGIDAALQASQVLVGITGAISKIASSPFGAETIAEIAIIIGALATGYGIVKSLQGNQPKLAKGDPYVKRNGNPAGVDTIPAWLNEGEAVTSAEKNKAYHPVIRAIHDGTVPAEQLNNFVKTFHNHKAVPQVDYSRIKDAAELHIGEGGKMAVAITEQNKLIIENNDLQRATIRALKGMGVNVNMDKNGIAVSVMEVVDQIEKDKKI